MSTRLDFLRSSVVAIACGVVFVAAARPAFAQPADDLVPAHFEGAAGARPSIPYPSDGKGDATVVLRLSIDDDGSVASAAVVRGDEPFATAARKAAIGWRFEPATKGGARVGSKLDFEVSFVDPTPPEPETSAPTAAPKEKPNVLEVTVSGDRHPPSVSSLTRSEVRQLPGAFGDPFRAIEILPGVTPIVSGLPFFYVRGAPPGNVGYFLDGIRVPYLFHVAVGPSVIHPGLVDRVDLYSGGYPAEYGRYAGAVVSAETTEPRTDWHGEANVRIVDLGALIEGGFGDGKGTALASGRFSYTAALFSLISPNITLDYRDFQTRVTYDITPHDRISLFAFGAYDYLSSTTNKIETVLFGSEFYRIDGRYRAKLPHGGTLTADETWGFDRTRIADGRNTQDILFDSRVVLKQPLSDSVTVRGGFDVQHDLYSAEPRPYVDPDAPDTITFNNLFPPRTDAVVSGWADVVWQVDPRFSVTPGVRVDSFFSNGAKATSFDPRLAATAEIDKHVRLLHAFGVAHQPPSFLVPIPGLAVANLSGGLQTSFQASGGVQVDLPLSTTATVTAFDSVFLNMTDTLGVDSFRNLSTSIPRSLGGAKGIEVYIRRSLSSRIGGFISYTFSRTTRTVDGLTFPAAFDRPHVLNTAVAFDLGAGWRFGTRFTIYSGAPILAPTAAQAATFDPAHPPRDPPFYRIDFRLEKKWMIRKVGGWVSFVAEMLNSTLNPETISGTPIGPVTIPSIGLEGGI